MLRSGEPAAGYRVSKQFAAVGGRDVHIDQLHRRELLDDAARGEPRRQCMQPSRQSGVQAIGQEGDEDMRFDPGVVLMEDRPVCEVLPPLPPVRLLTFFNSSSTLTF